METLKLSPSEHLKQEIQILKRQNKIFDWSENFLLKKIDKLAKLNQGLAQYEIETIKTQIENHKKLKELKDEYEKERQKRRITKKASEALSELFSEIESDEKVGQADIKEIKWILDEEEGKLKDNPLNLWDTSYRDNVESSLSFLWFNNDFYETPIEKTFLDLFTVGYINFLEDKELTDKHKNLVEKWVSALYLTEKELEQIIRWVLINMESNQINFIIEFSIVNKDGKISKKTINLSDKIKEVEAERQRREIIESKKKKKQLLQQVIIFENQEAKAKSRVSQKIAKIKEILWIKLEISEEELKERYIQHLLDEKIMTQSELLVELEKSENFNYLRFLEKYWITDTTRKVWLDLVEKILWVDIDINNKEKILHNLKIFISFIVDTESDWKNVDNTIGSSAKWYFQYLNWNWKNREEEKYSSFESALRRCYIYYTWSINVPVESFWVNSIISWLPRWVLEAYNDVNYNSKSLWAENQTILFLIDIFYKKWTNKHLKDMLLKWNAWSMRRLYEDFHHTNTHWEGKMNKDAEERTTEKIKKYWNQLKK